MADERLPLYEEVAARLLFDPAAERASIEERRMTNTERADRFPQPRDPRLRRYVVHDPRSRDYALPPAERAPSRAVAWPRVGPILDQGNTGSCTANAGLGLLMTQPFSRGVSYTEADALSLYHDETVLDEREIPGVYPPDDTGSAGLYMAKALQRRGLITSYHHAFSVQSALAALMTGPIAVGTTWLNSMMYPDRRTAQLTVDPRSGSDGGHEYVVDGWDPYTGYVRMTNSWSDQWGHGGSAYLHYRDFAWLLGQQGDVIQPVIAAPRNAHIDADWIASADMKIGTESEPDLWTGVTRTDLPVTGPEGEG